MDNASIHRSEGLQHLCNEEGVDLVFLPPYSPDMNPIEEVFHDIKAWIRRNRSVTPYFEDYGVFLRWMLEEVNTEVNALAHFKHCGWYC